MTVWRWTTLAMPVLAQCAWLPNAASAAVITENISFTASGFTPSGSLVDPVTGSFSVTFDPTQDYPNFTNGVTNFTSNIPVTGTAQFSYAQNGSVGEFGILVGYGQCNGTGCFEFDIPNPVAAFYTGNGSGSFQNGDFAFYDIGGQQEAAYTGTYSVSTAGAAVPEPATWSLALAGFGLIGGAMRRRDIPASIKFAVK